MSFTGAWPASVRVSQNAAQLLCLHLYSSTMFIYYLGLSSSLLDFADVYEPICTKQKAYFE